MSGYKSTPTCAECGRDNDNGTHSALERSGHLRHPFRADDEQEQQR